jgi:hypothetical protein
MQQWKPNAAALNEKGSSLSVASIENDDCLGRRQPFDWAGRLVQK